MHAWLPPHLTSSRALVRLRLQVVWALDAGNEAVLQAGLAAGRWRVDQLPYTLLPQKMRPTAAPPSYYYAAGCSAVSQPPAPAAGSTTTRAPAAPAPAAPPAPASWSGASASSSMGARLSGASKEVLEELDACWVQDLLTAARAKVLNSAWMSPADLELAVYSAVAHMVRRMRACCGTARHGSPVGGMQAQAPSL